MALPLGAHRVVEILGAALHRHHLTRRTEAAQKVAEARALPQAIMTQQIGFAHSVTYDGATLNVYHANKGEGCEPPREKSWDEIMLEVLDRIANTPGGRGEVG